MTDATEFAPISDLDWPQSIADPKTGFAGKLNVYRVMAHNTPLLRAWQVYRDHVVIQSSLTARQSEIVILRTGVLLNAPYEWAHHIVRGRKAGLSDVHIRAIKTSPQSLPPDDNLLVQAVDALQGTARLSVALQNQLWSVIGKAGILDVMATVGLYTTLAFIANSFERLVDRDITQALAENPLAE